MTYIEKKSYFDVARPGHTIAYKNIDKLLKNDVLICYIVSKYDAQEMFKFYKDSL